MVLFRYHHFISPIFYGMESCKQQDVFRFVRVTDSVSTYVPVRLQFFTAHCRVIAIRHTGRSRHAKQNQTADILFSYIQAVPGPGFFFPV